MHFVTELQTQLSAQAQECLAAVQQRLVAEARLKKVIQSRDNLAAELAELRSGAATRPEDPAATVAELEQRLAEAEALLAAERRAREEDRHRHETHGQETGQTQQQVENTLRFITELQTRLRAETQERLEAEDKRLIAEDKRGEPWCRALGPGDRGRFQRISNVAENSRAERIAPHKGRPFMSRTRRLGVRQVMLRVQDRAGSGVCRLQTFL